MESGSRRLAVAAGGSLLAVIAYLLLWPVPIEPVAWSAPPDRGFADPFAPNDLLAVATGIDLGAHQGPEDATLGPGGIFISTYSGKVLRYSNSGVEEFAATGGRPLGIATSPDGSLVVANAYLGLQRVSPDGDVESILTEIDGQPLVYANNLGIGADGTIYFSQASSKFGAASWGGTYEASLLDIMEHGGHGSIFAFDPATGAVNELLQGLNFANGVAVSADNRFLVVAETGQYRILKHWLKGPQAGETEVLLDNLPGFPDNVSNGLNDRFWIGIAAPRSVALDRLSGLPFARKIVQRLPAFLRPQAQPLSHVIAIDADGNVLMNMQDPSARYPTMTGVLETRDAMFVTTLFGSKLPFIAKRDLAL